MEQLSRVKKYQELRDSLEVDHKEDEKEIKTNTLKMPQEEYAPTHEKESTFMASTPVDSLDTTFKNEYLDSFIQEVRDYNIQKGNRAYEDTRLDILQQLNTKNREKRAHYTEEIAMPERIEEPVEESSKTSAEASNETLEISRQVLDLLREEEQEETVQAILHETAEPIQEPEQQPSELEQRIASLEEQLNDTTIQMQTVKSDVEETTKLKAQMDEYTDELKDVNKHVDSNNRLLNVIITILIIALLAVMGVIVYWLWAGGIL